ncbi:hypothetical protein [Methanoregula sp.]|uniref:hypothetical protein n=1 Tax=Methanoregula sp. TaxID=2052170 RepID=UPI000CAFA09D|nr:hypothetical protein [Methanoregula sp.]PKG31733.1 MAG: hypothetical protein CW742_11845 [Methanoregula sp.]
MSDGEFNYFGDPLARGTSYVSAYCWTSTYNNRHYWFSDLPSPLGTLGSTGMNDGTNQNMANYARNNNIRIYTIFFNDIASPSGTTWDTMGTLATETRGKRYHAKSGAELDNVYAEIAGDLKESAGIGTTVLMDFGSIVVNDQLDTSGNVFAYVADPETDGVSTAFAGYPANLGSTMVRKYNLTHELIPGPDYSDVGPLWDNMTPYWNANKQLYFTVGTVKLQETWETNFRMRVLKEGSINLMGPNSLVSFKDEDGTVSTLKLENMSSFTATSSTIFTGATWRTITIRDFERTDGDGDLTATVPVTWTTEYDGFRPVTHDVYFIHGSDPKVRFYQQVTTGGGTKTLFSQLDMSRLPGGQYYIYVHAYSDDAHAEAIIGPWQYNAGTRAFIKLE